MDHQTGILVVCRGIRVVSSQTLNPKSFARAQLCSASTKPTSLTGESSTCVFILLSRATIPFVLTFARGSCAICNRKIFALIEIVENRFVHLTNYSVNKNSDEFVKPTSSADGKVCSKLKLLPSGR